MRAPLVHLVRTLPVHVSNSGDIPVVAVVCRESTPQLLARTTRHAREATCPACTAERYARREARRAALAADLRQAVAVAHVHGVWSDTTPLTLYSSTPALEEEIEPSPWAVLDGKRGDLGAARVSVLAQQRERLRTLCAAQRANGRLLQAQAAGREVGAAVR